jgi:hypothetical protein
MVESGLLADAGSHVGHTHAHDSVACGGDGEERAQSASHNVRVAVYTCSVSPKKHAILQSPKHALDGLLQISREKTPRFPRENASASARKRPGAGQQSDSGDGEPRHDVRSRSLNAATPMHALSSKASTPLYYSARDHHGARASSAGGNEFDFMCVEADPCLPLSRREPRRSLPIREATHPCDGGQDQGRRVGEASARESSVSPDAAREMATCGGVGAHADGRHSPRLGDHDCVAAAVAQGASSMRRGQAFDSDSARHKVPALSWPWAQALSDAEAAGNKDATCTASKRPLTHRRAFVLSKVDCEYFARMHVLLYACVSPGCTSVAMVGLIFVRAGVCVCVFVTCLL